MLTLIVLILSGFSILPSLQRYNIFHNKEEKPIPPRSPSSPFQQLETHGRFPNRATIQPVSKGDSRTAAARRKSSWLPRDELGIALARASTADKTVIVAVINEAYVESDYPSMFDLFLEGFWVGERTRPLLRHLVVVSMDKAAHERDDVEEDCISP
ncbi:hypothetical protein SASPL_102759 [Salvia splendens]|uniref:Uncharacterized protein n=1 Tax=Salvia splendens TaxID=180675 RepID=A0A8X8YU75_SALSN|nr:hypothetical protein SASPL_102759 [Salvia splendens]